MTDAGTYLEHDGRPAVRFARTYAHPVERVWAAVTDPDELEHWFPSRVEMELAVGATVRFSGDPNGEDTFGRVLECEPPRRLAFSWGDDELHFDLAPSAGGCTFTLTNVLSQRDTAARNAAGWTVCLVELDRVLAGRPGDGPHGEQAEPWKVHYDAYVAAGMPAGAPIPDASAR